MIFLPEEYFKHLKSLKFGEISVRKKSDKKNVPIKKTSGDYVFFTARIIRITFSAFLAVFGQNM